MELALLLKCCVVPISFHRGLQKGEGLPQNAATVHSEAHLIFLELSSFHV